MVKVPRYSHHRHTGRLRPHHETSYGWLMGVVFLVGAMLLGVSWGGAEAALSGGESVNVHAVVSAPKPTTAPVITSPSNGQSFAVNPVTVAGTCPANTFVKVFSNGVLVGSVVCGQDHKFSLQVTLLVGQNSLKAVAFNINDDSGPTSATVTVTLTTPPGGPGFSNELLLQSITYYRGAPPGTELVWPVTLVGGVPPYAVSYDWGDSKQDLASRIGPGPFELRHTYTKPGGYMGAFPLIIRATDSSGHSAYLQLTSIVNEPGGSTDKPAAKPASSVAIAWPFWVLLVLIVVAFWLGERWEKRQLVRKLEALA